jgi:hypothetical protein
LGLCHLWIAGEVTFGVLLLVDRGHFKFINVNKRFI